MAASSTISQISSRTLYENYYGIPIPILTNIHANVRHLIPDARFIYLAGDSSLDNKFWLSGDLPAVPPYDQFLEPPRSIPDVAHWINHFLQEDGIHQFVAVNGAVEESTLEARNNNHMLRQDCFIAEHLTSQDVVIISAGGNDIALRPSIGTIWNALKMIHFNDLDAIENRPRSCWGMPYFEHMFLSKLTRYIQGLTVHHQPAAIIVCMIYYPDERTTGSWADTSLGALSYNSNPLKLQAAIRAIYRYVGQELIARFPELRIIPFALYDVLDGKRTSDYIARVEPSQRGGRRMGRAFVDRLQAEGILGSLQVVQPDSDENS